MRKLFFSSILLFNFCGASNPIGLPERFDDFLRVNSGYILFKDDPEMAKLDRELLNDIRRTRDKELIKEFEDLGTDSGEPRITYRHGYESNGVPTLYFGCREQKLSKYPELKQRFDRFNELFQNDKAQKKLFEK